MIQAYDLALLRPVRSKAEISGAQVFETQTGGRSQCLSGRRELQLTREAAAVRYELGNDHSYEFVEGNVRQTMNTGVPSNLWCGFSSQPE